MGFANLDSTQAASGSWSALLKEEDTNDDEMVFYSEPVAVDPDSWYKISVKVKREAAALNSEWLPSNIIDFRADSRMSVCFFYHRNPIKSSWDLTGGDQFFYFDERAGDSDWREFSVISKSPADAAGISVRARFNPFTEGLCWYDDFMR